jgi:short subunit dehydrogenase-like uncharacterized protein
MGPRRTSGPDLRLYDLVVFGATGDTGHAVTQYLTRRAPEGLRWAIAGRSESKLRQLHAALGVSKDVGIILASCDDAESMTQMAQSTRCVLTTAGPYRVLGEAVILACLARGTHYVDITGEVDWVGAMKEKYAAQAKAAGICLCSFCGYDCVPSELSVFLAAKALPAAASLRTAECVFSISGGLGGAGAPRGTLITMLTAAGRPLSFGLGLMRYAPPQQRMPLLRSLLLWLLPWWSRGVGAFTVPHFMGWCNTPVVHASCAATPGRQANEMRFSDRMLLPIPHPWWSLWGLLPVLVVYIACILASPAILLLVAIPPVRRWALRSLEATYTYAGSEQAQVTVRTRVTGSGGEVASCTLTCPGDPGIRCTALLAAETALTVLEARAQLGAGSPSGMTTPVLALGDALVHRLRSAGVQLVVSSSEQDGGMRD